MSIRTGRYGMLVVAICLGLTGMARAEERQWTIPDIVDVRQIQSVAISGSGRDAAYVLREPSVATDSIRYRLYEVRLDGNARPKRLLDARYISDVTRSANSGKWTVLADMGQGVQLYDVSGRGVVNRIAASSSRLMVGTYAGAIPAFREPRLTGVWSYQWSPDGSKLWYSTFRVRTAEQARAFVENGVEYDDRKDSGLELMHFHGELLGFELHVERSNGSGDHVVAFVPAKQILEVANLRRDFATALWMPDSRHIEYTSDVLNDSGKIVASKWSVDTRTGVTSALSSQSPWWLKAVPTSDGQGYYEVGRIDGADHLLEHPLKGRGSKDLGRVPFSMVGMMRDYPGGTWIDSKNGTQILSVLYHHHTGLVSLPETAAGLAWSRIKDNLNPCDFSRDLLVGVCVRQSQKSAPEVVMINGRTGALKPVARPNADYAKIAPLRIELERWTNRYGQRSDGYVFYPRRFSPKRKYPVIVVSHVNGAINTFADQGMIQAEIPVQALAENGYLVVEANTPWVDMAAKPWQFSHLRASVAAVRHLEMEFIQSPVASMEAALESLVQAGIADPAKTGIAGYSDGAALSLFAMTQSRAFRVASIDDGASGTAADEYWQDGARSAQFFYRSLYGGSPFSSDPAVLSAYRRFSPDFRAALFAGPVLEQPTAESAWTSLSRLTFLREAGIPYDLVFYPDESHIFWNPRASAASMERTLDWFNYWLLGKRSADPSKSAEYRRWDAMRAVYGKRCPRCLVGLGPWTVASGGYGSWPKD